jgi:hypothetical protein
LIHVTTTQAIEGQHREHQAWCQRVGATRVHLSNPPATLANMCKAAAGAPVLLTLKGQIDRPVVLVTLAEFERLRLAAEGMR